MKDNIKKLYQKKNYPVDTMYNNSKLCNTTMITSCLESTVLGKSEANAIRACVIHLQLLKKNICRIS